MSAYISYTGYITVQIILVVQTELKVQKKSN